MVTAVTAGVGPHAPAGVAAEGFERPRCDAEPSPIQRALGPLCIGTVLVADGLQLGHALLEQWIGDVGNSVLYLAVLVDRYLRSSSRPVMSGIVDSGPES
jgi:hypothetical protein